MKNAQWIKLLGPLICLLLIPITYAVFSFAEQVMVSERAKDMETLEGIFRMNSDLGQTPNVTKAKDFVVETVRDVYDIHDRAQHHLRVYVFSVLTVSLGCQFICLFACGKKSLD